MYKGGNSRGLMLLRIYCFLLRIPNVENIQHHGLLSRFPGKVKEAGISVVLQLRLLTQFNLG